MNKHKAKTGFQDWSERERRQLAEIERQRDGRDQFKSAAEIEREQLRAYERRRDGRDVFK